MNVANFFIGHDQLLVLSIVDAIIVYLFCTLQISYNTLTTIYILKAKSRVNVKELGRAYLFAFAPVVYSLIPILLVLYFYNPNPNIPDTMEKLPGKEFALKLVGIHLPPTFLVFVGILIGNIVAGKVNRKVNTGTNLKKDGESLQNLDQKAEEWDVNTKVIFRKAIFKGYQKTIKEISIAKENKDLKTLLKLSAKIEGWYIAKRRFQFFWCTKKSYTWIKKYYLTHYLGLRFYLYNAYIDISDN